MCNILTWLNNNEGLGTWLGAVGTAGALISAAVTYQNAERRRRREQASRVVLAVEHRYASHPVDDGGPWSYQYLCAVRNESSDTITRVVLQILSDRGIEDQDAATTSQLAPGVALESNLSFAGGAMGSLRVHFKDATGQAWRRTESGALERIKSSYYWPEHEAEPPS